MRKSNRRAFLPDSEVFGPQWRRLSFILTIPLFLLASCATQGPASRPPLATPVTERGPMAGQAMNLPPQFTARVKGEKVSGRIMLDGSRPLKEGRVAFFAAALGPPSNDGNLRRIPEVVTVVHQDGTFSLRLPAGHYFLGAIKKDSSAAAGPPASGEKTFVAVDGHNNRQVFNIKEKEETKLGSIMVGAEGLLAPPEKDTFSLTGTVMDATGRPVEGAVLLIRTSVQAKRPNFIWSKTARDGRFQFRLPTGRSYYILARDKKGPGRPSPGQRVGAYTGTSGNLLPKPVPVSGKSGETISGLNIVLNQLPDPNVQKRKFQNRPRP